VNEITVCIYSNEAKNEVVRSVGKTINTRVMATVYLNNKY